MGLLVIAPIGIAVAILSVFAPMDHPAGDLRDDIVFRLLAAVLFGAFMAALLIGSVRLLRRRERGDPG